MKPTTQIKKLFQYLNNIGVNTEAEACCRSCVFFESDFYVFTTWQDKKCETRRLYGNYPQDIETIMKGLGITYKRNGNNAEAIEII